MKKILISTFIFLTIINQAFAFTISSETQKTVTPKYTISQNESLEDTFVINNNTAKPLNLNLSIVDGYVGSNGNPGFKTSDQNSVNLGSWAKFSEKELKLNPNEKKTIKLNISIPQTATPGTYLGGISMNLLKPETESSPIQINKDSGTSVEVKTRYISPIQLTIPGEIINKFSISALNFDQKNKQFYFFIENQGNTLLRAKGELILINKNTGKSTAIGFNQSGIQQKTIVRVNIPTNLNREYFGFFKAKASTKLEYYDSVEDQYKSLSNESLEMEIDIIPWQDINFFIIILVIAISSIIFKKYLNKQYLNSCSEYIVKSGETLTTIAQKHKMSWKKLAKINKLSPPYDLKPETKILVHKTK